MLAVKILEMSANPALQTEGGSPRTPLAIALVLGWASVFGFALWLGVQGSEIADVAGPVATGEVGEQLACIDRAQTAAEIAACTS